MSRTRRRSVLSRQRQCCAGSPEKKTAGTRPADSPSSWPGLTRPSTSYFFKVSKKVVDARHKAGHDGVISGHLLLRTHRMHAAGTRAADMLRTAMHATRADHRTMHAHHRTMDAAHHRTMHTA